MKNFVLKSCFMSFYLFCGIAMFACIGIPIIIFIEKGLIPCLVSIFPTLFLMSVLFLFAMLTIDKVTE